MPLPPITGEYRIGSDPELRFTPTGMAVAECRAVASQRKKLDNGDWVDDKTTWVTLTMFGAMAENFVESVEKGMQVLLQGRLHIEPWETSEGEKRTTPKILVDLIGPSLKFATAKVTKTQRSDASTGGQPAGGQGDPWASPAPAQQSSVPVW